MKRFIARHNIRWLITVVMCGVQFLKIIIFLGLFSSPGPAQISGQMARLPCSCWEGKHPLWEITSSDTRGYLQGGSECEVVTITSGFVCLQATLTLLLLIGPLGDRFGRRLPVVVPCLGGALYSVSNIVNSVYMDWWPHYLMIGPVRLAGFPRTMLVSCSTRLCMCVCCPACVCSCVCAREHACVRLWTFVSVCVYERANAYGCFADEVY